MCNVQNSLVWCARVNFPQCLFLWATRRLVCLIEIVQLVQIPFATTTLGESCFLNFFLCISDFKRLIYFHDKAESCARLFTRGRRSNGFYNIHKPYNVQVPKKESYIRLWCDMEGLNSGWTLLQRRSNATFNFFRDWVSYEEGFGEPGFDYWLGNSYVHAITFQRKYVLRFEFPGHFDDQKQMLFLEYENFQVLSATTGYMVKIGKHRGSMIDFFPDSNNSAFSTWDRDNDQVRYATCAWINKGAWWYAKDCYAPDPNSMYQFRGITIVMKAKELLGGKVSHYTDVLRESALPVAYRNFATLIYIYIYIQSIKFWLS